SPFLLLQGGSFFGHVVTALLVLCAVGPVVRDPVARKISAIAIAGTCCGFILCARPLTGVIVGLFCTGYMTLAARKDELLGIRNAATYVLGAVPGAALLLAYDAALTGKPLLTPHDQLLPHEIGFGSHMISNTAVNVAGYVIDASAVPLLLPLLFLV